MRRIAPLLLALALLCACGPAAPAPTSTPTAIPSPTATIVLAPATTAPTGTPTVGGRPTFPAVRPVPRPSPDPTAVAAGAPLRATLLAQIAEAERRCVPATRVGTPGTAYPCRIGLPGVGERDRYAPTELVDYLLWNNLVRQCRYNPTGTSTYYFTAVALSFTPTELRDPAMLDVFVAGTPWCDVTRDRIPGRVPAATRRP